MDIRCYKLTGTIHVSNAVPWQRKSDGVAIRDINILDVFFAGHNPATIPP